MFMLKQAPAVKKSYASVDIETLLKDQGLSIKYKVLGEQNVGQR